MLLLTLAPVLVVDRVPLMDYPNHLARGFALAHYDELPVVQASYDVVWGMWPNLGMELVFALLLPWLGIYAAAKVYIVLCVLCAHAGALALGRALRHGRHGSFAPYALYLFYTLPLFYGFVNYVLGLGVFYGAMALWLRWLARADAARGDGAAGGEASDPPRSRRVGVETAWWSGVTALAFACYVAHLSAFACLGIGAATWLVATRRERPWRRALVALTPLLVPLVAHALTTKLGAASGMAWSGVADTLATVTRLLRTYDLAADIAFTLAFFGALAYAVVVSRRPVRRPALAVAAALLVCFLFGPTTWNGIWAASLRFLPPAVMLFFLAFEVDAALPRVRVALAVALCALGVRALYIAAEWRAIDRRMDGYVALMQSIPEGARVLPASGTSPASTSHREHALAHVHHYALIERHAFVANMFARLGQQPLVLKPNEALRTPGHARAAAPESFDWATLMTRFDTIWTIAPPPPWRELFERRCASVARWEDAAVYRDCTPP